MKYFEKHFEMTHPDVYNLKVISMFSPVSGQKLIENVASVSTQPLWVRDESKTKSIRGILFEEEASGSTSASPTNTSKSTSPKVVEANDAAPVSSVYSGAGSGEVRFGCEHCNKPFPDMQRLIKHWDIQHKNQIMVAQANELQNRPGKPFRFILQKLHGQDGPVDFLTDAFFARTFASTKFILECGVCHFKTCMGLELDAHFASKHNMTNTINNSSRIVKPLALRVSADATLTFECHYRTKTTLCKYSSSDVKVFAKHWRDHVAHHLYGCTYCTRTADTLAHLMEHCKEQHPNEYAESSNSNRKFGFKKLEVSHPEMQRSLQETKVVLVNGLVLSLRELDKTAYNPTKVITNEIEAICAEEFRKFQQLQLQQQNKKSQILGDDSDNEDEDALVIDEDPRPETSNTEEPNLLISNEVLDVEDDLLQPMDEPALSNVDSCATEQQEIDFNKVYMILEEENITYNNFVKAYDSDPVVVIKEQCEDPIIQSNEESSGSDKTTTPEPVDPHLLIEDEKVITNLDNTEPEQLNVAINPLLTTVPIISAVHSSFEHMEIDSLYVG